MNVSKSIIVFLIIILKINAKNHQQKPNIIIIMADDLGFNDVGFHGSNQIPTPNMDALAYSGIILNKHYTAPICTPSRSCLMTGKYPSNVGMQHSVIVSDQPYALGLENKLMSNYMKEAGYQTHLIGKWHLGFYRKKYTPTKRGFDTHKGYLGGYIDYWNHTLFDLATMPNISRGLDMRNNLEIDNNTNGIYATDLFTNYAIDIINNHDKNKPLFMMLSHLSSHSGNADDPYQAPLKDVNRFKYIKDPNRRIYAAMVSRMDKGVGDLIDALNKENMLKNTIILFFSDNGAPTKGILANSGSNEPLRGQKVTPFEGGVRTSAAIWSPLLKTKQRVSNQMIHLTDWLPTFARLAGIKITDKSINGKDVWDALSYNLPSPRDEILCNIDQVEPYVALISGDWKYISGSTNNGTYDTWLGILDKSNQKLVTFKEYANQVISSKTAKALLPFRNNFYNGELFSLNDIRMLRKEATVQCSNGLQKHERPCKAQDGECLFNLKDDPCERNNLAKQEPNMVYLMKKKLIPYLITAQPPRNKPGDVRANPINFDNTWTWWYDELNIMENTV